MAASAASAAASSEPGSPSTAKPVNPLGVRGMYKTLEEAVFHSWNSNYDRAEAMLKFGKDRRPRYALEYAMLQAVKSLVQSSSESREKLLDFYQAADGMAWNQRASKPGWSDSDEENEEEAEAKLDLELAAAAAKDGIELSAEDKARLEDDKKRLEQIAAHRKESRAAFKASKKTADGASLAKWWQLECDVIYAEALLVRSILQLQLQSYIKGAYNLRKAWGYYVTLLKELEADAKDKKSIPKEIEMYIKCGAGIFYTYLSLVPGTLMSMLSAIGFVADRDLGEEYLTEVLQSNTVRSPVAAMVLLTFYLFIPTGLGDVHKTLAKVKPILDRTSTVFPKNCHFEAWAMFYHRKLGHTDDAMRCITNAVVAAEKTGQVPTLLRYLQGDTLYMSLNYEAAKVKYQEVLDHITKTGETFSYTGQLIISLAACYRMLGDKDTAISLLKTVGSRYNDKSKQDANSPKYAAKVLKEPRLLPLIGVYVLYINRDLAHMQGKYADQLQEDLTRVTTGEDLSPPEVRCMYWLFMGCMHKIANRKDEALRAWNQCRALEPKLESDSMTLPYVYYEMGEYSYRNGDLEGAKALFDKGQSLKGDGHETLANRYNIAQKQLKREIAAAAAAAAKK
jgi:hypothetical protein